MDDLAMEHGDIRQPSMEVEPTRMISYTFIEQG